MKSEQNLAIETTNSWPGLRKLLRGASRVAVMCHHSPDGDALGAIIGLSASLRLARWDARAISSSPVPSSYRFLPGWDSVLVYLEDATGEGETGGQGDGGNEALEVLKLADAIVCLDCSDLERLGHIYEENPALFEKVPIVNIDHHGSNSMYGTANLVDHTAASVCELLVQVMEREDLPITTEIADVLLAGILADTLGFRTSATSASTLRLAATLMERGASLSRVSESVFNKRSASGLKLWGSVLSRARDEDRLVWSDITQALLAECGATLADADTLVDFIAGVPGTTAAFLFSEQEGKVRVSMRTSRELNASDFAKQFGGGGHPRAAGCTLEGSMSEVQTRVLGEARRWLKGVAARREGQQEIDA